MSQDFSLSDGILSYTTIVLCDKYSQEFVLPFVDCAEWRLEADGRALEKGCALLVAKEEWRRGEV